MRLPAISRALLLLASGAVSCARATPTPAPSAASGGDCCLDDGRRIAERHRVAAISTRRFTHAQLWGALEPVTRSPAVRVTPIGQSINGRPLRAITVGSGPTTVLLWSQMHGDESTATMSLADILTWFTSTGERDALRDLLTSRLTMVLAPMLNPDGAELFQRENALGVDVNRDARRLATPRRGRSRRCVTPSNLPSPSTCTTRTRARSAGAMGTRWGSRSSPRRPTPRRRMVPCGRRRGWWRRACVTSSSARSPGASPSTTTRSTPVPSAT
ncbi:MAG: hypothetical protein IPN47_25705 [Gemmatimonadetes bacterium]|nr:hypothetical protein [Gemmatimonadota bacterium]